MHVPAILVDLRNRTLQRFADLGAQLLDQADDALFNLAQRSGAGSEEQDHLDSMRRLRRLRADLLQRFSTSVANAVAQPPQVQRGEEPVELPEGELSLIAVDDLEEQLAQERLAIAVARRHAEPLLRFGAAFARIWERPEVDDEAIPLAPLRVAAAFGQALQPAELPVVSRLVLFKLLERLLLSDFGDLLGELNQFLHGRGIAEAAAPLAQLRRASPGIVRGPRRGAGSMPAHELVEQRDWQAETGTEQDQAEASNGNQNADAWLSVMRDLFASYFGALEMAGQPAADGASQGGNASAGPFRLPMPSAALQAQLGLVPREEVVAILRRFQQQLPRSLLRAALQRNVTLGEQIKVDVQVELQRGGESKRRLNPADEQAMTLVGMLFEVLFDQSHFSPRLRGMLARLLPPYVQIALQDPELFAQRGHPARRLLNALTEAGDGNNGETPAEREALLRITAVVERIVREYKGDLDLLVDLEARFGKVVEQQKRRAALTERRTAESQRGRERLEDARTTASLEIAALTSGRHPPAPIDDFVRRDWGHHLTVVLLRAGEDSEEYAKARRIGVALWQALDCCRRGEPAPSSLREQLAAVDASTGRHRSGDVLAALEALRAPPAPLAQRAPQMTTEAVPASSAKPAPAAHAAAGRPEAAERAVGQAPTPSPTPTPIPPETVTAASAAAPLDEVTLPAPGADDAAASAPLPGEAPSAAQVGFQVVEKVGAKPELPTGDIELSIDPTQVQPGDLAKVRALTQGCWVDLVDAQGESQPAKLSWVSPISQRMLFVNRSGARLCLLSPPECAALITQHKLIPRAAEAAFDRAMVGLLDRLRSEREQANTDRAQG